MIRYDTSSNNTINLNINNKDNNNEYGGNDDDDDDDEDDGYITQDEFVTRDYPRYKKRLNYLYYNNYKNNTNSNDNTNNDNNELSDKSYSSEKDYTLFNSPLIEKEYILLKDSQEKQIDRNSIIDVDNNEEDEYILLRDSQVNSNDDDDNDNDNDYVNIVNDDEEYILLKDSQEEKQVNRHINIYSDNEEPYYDSSGTDNYDEDDYDSDSSDDNFINNNNNEDSMNINNDEYNKYGDDDDDDENNKTPIMNDDEIYDMITDHMKKIEYLENPYSSVLSKIRENRLLMENKLIQPSLSKVNKTSIDKTIHKNKLYYNNNRNKNTNAIASNNTTMNDNITNDDDNTIGFVDDTIEIDNDYLDHLEKSFFKNYIDVDPFSKLTMITKVYSSKRYPYIINKSNSRTTVNRNSIPMSKFDRKSKKLKVGQKRLTQFGFSIDPTSKKK
jgi:hypothetical protein